MARKYFGRLVVALALVSFAMGAAVSAATVTASGKINAIDFIKKKINVNLMSGGKLTLTVPGSASIKRNGTRATLKGLSLGDDLTVQYIKARKVATSLAARGPSVIERSGSLKAIDTGTGILMIGLKSYATDSGTRISRNGRVVSLGQLTRKDNVVLHTRTDTGAVRDILSCGPAEGEAEGSISAISLATSQITIAPGNGALSVTLTANASTIIRVNHTPATLAGLQTGMRVEAVYHLTTKVAFLIEADTECQDILVQGTAAAVDAVAGSLTVMPGDGSAALTLWVNAATEIEVNGAHANLADVAAGMPVIVEYHALTFVAKEIEAGTDDTCGDPEVESDIVGTISAVSATSLTIVPQTGVPLTLSIDGSTRIEFDDDCDRAATIDDIQVGTMVEVSYDVAALLALEIEIDLDCTDYDCGDDGCGDGDCGDIDCGNDDCGDDDCGGTDCGDGDCEEDDPNDEV